MFMLNIPRTKNRSYGGYLVERGIGSPELQAACKAYIEWATPGPDDDSIPF